MWRLKIYYSKNAYHETNPLSSFSSMQYSINYKYNVIQQTPRTYLSYTTEAFYPLNFCKIFLIIQVGPQIKQLYLIDEMLKCSSRYVSVHIGLWLRWQLVVCFHRSIYLSYGLKGLKYKIRNSFYGHTLIFNTSFSLLISKSCRSFPFILSMSRSRLQQEGSISESEPFWIFPQRWNEQTCKSQTCLFPSSTNSDTIIITLYYIYQERFR